MHNLKPQYHFRPEKNWMNDPNGVIYYKNEYHLFYQYNPNSDQWGDLHWGHAKSKDLVHWENLPVALYPSKELGEEHCFSGCCVNDNGVPTIFYTSIGLGERNHVIGAEQWMARSYDDMITWEKYSNNPIITSKIHGGLVIEHWRDPFVFQENNFWYMVLGGSHDKKGCVLIYRSQNLIDWEFLNIFFESLNEEVLLECPNLFKIKDKYVLVYSPDGIVKYYIGTISEDFKFIPEKQGTIDHGGWQGYYAPNSLCDDRHRRVMWGWLPENARKDFKGCAGWSGVQSLPRTLDIKNNKLQMKPAKELEVLRKNKVSYTNIDIENEWKADIKGRTVEIVANFEINQKETFAIDVLCSDNDEEKTSIIFNSNTKEIIIDRAKSSCSGLTNNSIVKANVDLEDNKELNMHIFIDHSILEVFINYEECITTRIYPIKDDSDNIKIRNIEGDTRIKCIDIWEMESIFGL